MFHYKVVFEGIIGSNFESDTAIDDIFIDIRGPCRPTASCNFEDSICLWSQVSTNAFNMLRITSEQLRTILGINDNGIIIADTTLNDRYGHFLWFNQAYSNVGPSKTSNLMSQTIFFRDYSEDMCFSFNYVINGGNNPGTINIYRRFYNLTTNKLEYSISGNSGNDWNRLLIPFEYTLTNFEIYIEVVSGTTNGSIAIDDVFLHKQNCSYVASIIDNEENIPFSCGDGNIILGNQVCNFITDCADGRDEISCANCNFENSTCNYRELSSGSIKWSRIKAQAAPNGPFIDNTLGNSNGHFMLIQESDQIQDGLFDEAILRLNQILKPCSSICQLEFYYHMFGASDDLSVFIVEENTKSLLQELSGNFGDIWQNARLPIGKISKPFRLEFRGTRYFSNSDFDLAIDDVKLINCDFPPARASCPNDFFTCKRKACVQMSRVCDLTDDCGDNSDEADCDGYSQCNFEDGFCNWRHDESTGLFKWRLNKGETEESTTGPTRDHTTGTSTGQYAFIKARNQLAGSKARLISSTLKVNQTTLSNSCEMRAYYHMYGQNIGSLKILTRNSIGGEEKILFQKQGEVGNYWERADLVIKDTNAFQIIIEAIVGNGALGDIAIDDISFNRGCILDDTIVLSTSIPLSTTTQPPFCGNDKFQCVNLDSNNAIQCVDKKKVCDFEYDCFDKSDEAMCGTCDFETSLCGWYDKSSNRFNWLRTKAPSSNPQGAQIDHTYLNNTSIKGYFAATQLTNVGSFSGRVDFWGPVFQETSANCKMKFWLNMFNTGSRMSIYYTNASNTGSFRLLQSISNGFSDYNWRFFTVNIGANVANYQIEINAYPYYTNELNYTDIALDDIEFSSCSKNFVEFDKSLNCNFDESYCDYYNDAKNDIIWNRKANRTYTSAGPLYDHTTKNGYYVLFSPTSLFLNGKTGRLQSTIQKTLINQYICYEFWYLMFAESVNRLNFYIDQHDLDNNNQNVSVFNRTLLWTKYGSQGRRWFNAKRTLWSNIPWKVSLEGVTGKTVWGEIALDDLSATLGKCPPSKQCDFEVGDSCEYTNVEDGTANLKWTVGKAFANSIDHTTSTNTGQFIYVNVKDSSINSKARLASVNTAPTGSECVQFWYLFNATSQGFASLSIYERVGTNYGNPKWSKNSEANDNEWRYGQVEVATSTTSEFSVVFEANKLTGNTNSDIVIGLDDINTKIGGCKAPVNCDFEDYNMCSWTQSLDDKFDWLLNQGQTDTTDTGPHVDVTLGTNEGVYMYIESSSPAKAGDNSILLSEYLSPTQFSCFGLWYFMYGKDIGNLHVWVNDTMTGLKLMKNISSEQGFAWQPLYINVSSSNDFRVAIEGVVRKFYIFKPHIRYI